MNPTRRPYFRKLKRTIFGMICCTVAWMLGLSYFVSLIPRQQAASEQAVDAVVVLTASPEHVHQSFLLVARDLAKEVYIPDLSTDEEERHLARHKGNNIKVTFNQLAPAAGPQTKAKGALEETPNYANKVATWVANKKIKSIRVVVNNYHVPRIISEMKRALPQSVEVIAAPVFDQKFDISVWLRDSHSRKLVVGEYYRFLTSHVQHILKRLESIAPYVA